MTITFVGHSHIFLKNKIKEIVKEQILCNVTDFGTVVCYLGGYGDFDDICACVCRELKQEYTNIEVVYVAPYMSISQQTKIKEMQRCGLCDSSIYPPIENAPPKFAIVKRNEWMVRNADLIIAYMEHNWGGAYKTLQAAKRERKRIINVCDFL